jgi:periplasmic protein CpxP/Spy
MRRNLVILGVAAAAVVLIPVALIAAGGPGGGGFGHGRGMGMGPGGFGMDGFGMQMLRGRLAEKLGLSDAQKTQIKSILEDARPAMQQIRQDLRTARQQFLCSQSGGTFDEAAVRAFVKSQEPQFEDAAVLAAQVRSRIYNVLTADQQAKLKELKQEAHDLFGKGPGPCSK